MKIPGGDILEDQYPYKALYLHIPFCKSKCLYCDFNSEAISSNDEAIERYVDDLILQIRAASRADLLGSLDTVYIGGGTPTHIGNKELSRLLYGLSLSMHLTPEVECTLEVNPESLTEAMVKDLFALGVTRLSIGVQSFDDEVLKTLGRAHDAAQAKRAIELAQIRFTNISVDLMCGLPGQTKESFIASLKTAVDLGVTHISIYPLSIEEGTPLHGLMERQAFAETEDDLGEYAAEMMLLAQEYLETQGFHRYEVASYAKPGFECRHNKAYWTGKPYLGIGRAAVTMKQNYDERIRMMDSQVQEELSRPEYLVEDLMLGMRMSRGVSVKFAVQVDEEVPGALDAFKELIDSGYVKEVDGRFEPTEKGWLWGNALYGRLLELA
ncbi:radical SAM family heme chaperone HemW [Anaerotardibacter muris]|uniref:radical SAM family heme chaperone HemW n=1 Tax=Anaerotardibacter muris TaxID=2941505 RepID=UPI00203D682A|nr:radical SAM family heme chaperone HemW [Anaerotardibacter muris]